MSRLLYVEDTTSHDARGPLDMSTEPRDGYQSRNRIHSHVNRSGTRLHSMMTVSYHREPSGKQELIVEVE